MATPESGVNDGVRLAAAHEAARHKHQKKIIDDFWKNPDARLLLIANYLHVLETHPAGPLMLRTVGFQYRIIRQAEEYMRIYEKVQQILEGVDS